MKFIKIVVIIFVLVLLIFICFLIFSTLNDYKPEKSILIYNNDYSDTLSVKDVYTAISWNIGYCGLNAQMDFFYDGGKNVYPPKDVVLNNLKNIIDTLKLFSNNVDFLLLQEVDINSRRSYYIDQLSSLEKEIYNLNFLFALNYNVKFVPVPFKKPMGKVESGIVLATKYKPLKAYRISLPSDYPWPKKLFMLDRCCILMYMPVENGKFLVVINTHNSAYDDGTLRTLQNQELQQIMLDEFRKGNYVIAGGDWNQIPYNFKPEFNNEFYDSTYYPMSLPIDFPDKNWKVCYDNKIPSNRNTGVPYVKNKTAVTTIDFFIISPNIEIIDVKNLNFEFKYSDHNPVLLKFKLL